ncbi:hypothetical protein M1349_00370 [Patescibacteria group bacterium]|nr:hypothetical protein [Patescibacteria group bacterium]
MRNLETTPVFPIIREKEQKPAVFGIRQENLTGEVMGVVRRIYSKVSGKDIIRKRKKLSPASPRVDFKLHPDAINTAVSWGRSIEYISGSEVSPSTKLVVEYDLRTDLITFKLDPGEDFSRENRGEKMENKFNRLLSKYLLRKDLAVQID